MMNEKQIPKQVRDSAQELTDFYRNLETYAEALEEHKQDMETWQKESAKNVVTCDTLLDAVRFFIQNPVGYSIFAYPETAYCAVEMEGWVKALFAGYRMVIHDPSVSGEAREALEALAGMDTIEEI